MDVEKQKEIMRKQLACFDNIFEKMQYMIDFFDKDPQFSEQARYNIKIEILEGAKSEHT